MLVVGSDESEPAKARAAVACRPSRLRVVDVGTASAVLMIGGSDESEPAKARAALPGRCVHPIVDVGTASAAPVAHGKPECAIAITWPGQRRLSSTYTAPVPPWAGIAEQNANTSSRWGNQPCTAVFNTGPRWLERWPLP